MEHIPMHFLNGTLVPEHELVISVRDLGLLRGYAVFDFLITYPPQRPFMLDRHIDRLFRSAAVIGLAMPWEKAQVRQWVLDTLAANADGKEKAIKIVVTGGVSSTILPETAPTIAILVDTRTPFPDSWYEKGVAVTTAKFRRYAPEAKTNDYIEGVIRTREGAAKGAFEPIYYDDTQVYEAVTSNVFAVIDGALVTPKSGILEGITRAVLLEILPPAGIPVEVRDITIDDLRRATELFLAASNKDVLPITTLDGVPVGGGAVGPITRKAMEQFAAFTRSDAW
jgi:branched-chain amino acid aminotransferase